MIVWIALLTQSRITSCAGGGGRVDVLMLSSVLVALFVDSYRGRKDTEQVHVIRTVRACA